jgi:hypothetical protein
MLSEAKHLPVKISFLAARLMTIYTPSAVSLSSVMQH